MITLPTGFDGAALFSEFLSWGVPFVTIAAIITAGVVFLKLFKRC